MFEVLKARAGENEGKWMWNLRLASGGRIIACSEQAFAKRSQALADIKRVKDLAFTATITEVIA